MNAVETVRAFLAAAAERNYDEALPLLTEDVEYQNMMLPPVHGRAAVRDTLEALLALCSESQWLVHRELADGDVVMNERTDRFRLGDSWTDLPVMGVFELRDGRIALWRDYFDLQTVLTAMQAAQGQPDQARPAQPTG
jgi:limonene-1,2-epoxide hydrolase